MEDPDLHDEEIENAEIDSESDSDYRDDEGSFEGGKAVERAHTLLAGIASTFPSAATSSSATSSSLLEMTGDFLTEEDLAGPGAPEEDLMGEDDFEEQLQNLSKKSKKKSKLSPKLSRLMGEANMAYALREYSKAVGLLLDIIRQAPNVADPYHTLGLIYEDMGDKKKALEFFMIAAHISPKDAPLWRRLGLMSRDVGNTQQAIYCYSKAIRLDPADCDAIWDRSVIYAEKGKHAKAIRGFVSLHELTEGDTDVSKELARLYHQTGQTDKAISVLSTSLDKWKEKHAAGVEQGELDLDMVNMLAELFMSMDNYQQAIALIDDTHKRLSTQALPLDLTINFGICQAHMNNIALAERQFEKLMEKNVNTYGDLFFDVAETFTKVGEPAKAAMVFERLVQNPAYNVPSIWQMQAQGYKDSGNTTSAINTYLEVVRAEPNNVEARLALSELYKETGNYDAAIAVVSHNSVPLSQRQESGDSRMETDAAELSERPLDGDYSEQDLEWLDGEHVKMTVQKGLLYFHLGQHREFLDTVLPLILASCRSGRNTTKSFTRSRRRGGRRGRRRRAKRQRRPRSKPEPEKVASPEEADQSENLLQFHTGSGRRKSAKDASDKLTTNAPTAAEPAPVGTEEGGPPDRAELTSIVEGGDQPSTNTSAEASAGADDEEAAANAEAAAAKKDKGKEKDFGEEGETTTNKKGKGGGVGDDHDDEKDEDYEEEEGEGEEEDEEVDKTTDRLEDSDVDSDEDELNRITEVQRDTSVFEAIVNAITLDAYFDLVLKVCKSLVALEEHADAASIVKDLLTCKFIEKEKKDQLHFLYVGVAFDHGDFEAAYEGIRLICLRNPQSTRAWNLLNTTTIRMGRFNSKSHHKFIVRQLLRSPNSVPLMILAGHDCNISGTHKFALGEYFRAYHLQPKHPMISLCIGLTYLAQVMNRRRPERHYMVLQAFTFLYQYHFLREGENPQEAAYNVGRSFHQLGLVHLAVPYYEKALTLQAPDDYPIRDHYDLKREAAYNLSLIYKASGAPYLALQITRQYCIV